MIIVSVGMGILCLLLVVSPFFFGKGGFLVECDSVLSVEKLEKSKKELLARYLREEALYKDSKISEREWNGRRELLTSKYVDIVRRADHLGGAE